MKLHNTMSGKKEEFIPLKEGHTGIYSCGPTVYSRAHIGNLRAYIFSDVLRKALRLNGYKVKQVMNITDVGHLTSDSDTGEDKMEKGAQRERLTVWDIAEKYTKLFREDIAKLNIEEPDIWCKATEHIDEQINLVKKIMDNGFAYRLKDGIYFDTSKLDDYGRLARLDPEGLKEGARVAKVEGKRNPTDFALWKFSPKDKQRQMEWDSPWGKGFPGWHIECSAMSMKYLGEVFDIHTGGVDHIPVHHPNEIAQAKAAHGKEFVRYWLHNEFLVMPTGKMSKSLGNINDLSSLEEAGISPLDYRYFCLNTHYRKQLMFSEEAMKAAKNSLARLRNRILELKREDKEGSDAKGYKERIMEMLSDDLNIPKALGVLQEMLSDESLSSEERVKTALFFDKNVLGLDLDKGTERNKKTLSGVDVYYTGEVDEEIIRKTAERENARKEKDFDKADKIRDELKEKGYTIKDRKEGPEIQV
ncbi:MAG: cysteine--tRNA ligase [Nanobdellota archaeon]